MNSYKTPLGLSPLLARLDTDLLLLSPPLTRALAELSWPQVIALVTFPICAAKQGINCVQFWKASKALTEADQEDRWLKLHETKKDR